MKKCTSSLVRASDQIHGQRSTRSVLNFSYFTVDSSFLRLYPRRTVVLAMRNVELECDARSMALQLSAGTGSPARSSVAQSSHCPSKTNSTLHEIFRISSLISAVLNPLCPVLSSQSYKLLLIHNVPLEQARHHRCGPQGQESPHSSRLLQTSFQGLSNNDVGRLQCPTRLRKKGHEQSTHCRRPSYHQICHRQWSQGSYPHVTPWPPRRQEEPQIQLKACRARA